MKYRTLALLLLVGCAQGPENVPTNSECDRDRDCDDSIACTADRCVQTVNGFLRCDNTPDHDLCPAGRLCMADSLLGPGCQDPVRLACADRGDGESCVPADACAVGEGICAGGACGYERVQCPEKPCMATEGCDAVSGVCRYTIQPDNVACDMDGDRCTDDRCLGGRCVQGPDHCECSESRPCVQPDNLCLGQASCRDGVCVSTPVDCTPFNTGCLINYCLPATGLCEPIVVNEGGVCSDELACTGPGVCKSGACVAAPLTCPDKACNSVACVEPGGCRYAPAPGECDDGNMCNGPDACEDGDCMPVGAGISCDDRNACTSDECLPASGLCRHLPIAGCCGNSVLEAGEQCDGLDLPGTGCSGCEFTVVSLDFAGAGPRFAWSDELDAGMVTWEVVDGSGGHGVALRPLSALGAFGQTLPLPAGTVNGRSMSPVVAATADGFILGALAADGPAFWLLDPGARPRIRTSPRNSGDPGTPTGRMVMAHSALRSIAAWVVAMSDGSQRILYSDIAVGPDQLLVSGAATLFETNGSGEIIPGDACPVADGVVVTFAVRSEDLSASVVTQKAAYFQGDNSASIVFDLAVSEWDQSYPTACAATPDGFLAVYTRREKQPVMRIAVEGVLVDPADGPGLPFELESIAGNDGPHVMPFASDLFENGTGSYLYLCPLVEPDISAPETVSPAIIAISAQGKVLSGPEPLEGPALDFAGGLAGGMAAGGTLSVFWVETADISSMYDGGQVAGRLYAETGF